MSTAIIPQSTTTFDPTSTIAFDASLLAGQLAPSSIAMYARDFRAYLAFAGTPAAALEPATLARWRAVLAADTSLSPHTINRMLSAVKRLIKEAAVQGYAAHETAKAFERIAGVKAAALKDRTKLHARTRITPADMRRLCDAPDRSTLRGLRDAAILATLASSGLRVAELAGLEIGQILKKGNGFMLSVRGKNDTEYREAPLSREAHRLIMEWMTARPVLSQHVFTSFAGRGQRATAEPLSPVAVWRIVQGYADQVELSHIKPHDFRRFVGTQLAKSDIRKAQKALGHKRIDTTARHYVLDELEPGLTDNLY
jgi:site-specific recombinase XerD